MNNMSLCKYFRDYFAILYLKIACRDTTVDFRKYVQETCFTENFSTTAPSHSWYFSKFFKKLGLKKVKDRFLNKNKYHILIEDVKNPWNKTTITHLDREVALLNVH